VQFLKRVECYDMRGIPVLHRTPTAHTLNHGTTGNVNCQLRSVKGPKTSCSFTTPLLWKYWKAVETASPSGLRPEGHCHSILFQLGVRLHAEWQNAGSLVHLLACGLQLFESLQVPIPWPGCRRGIAPWARCMSGWDMNVEKWNFVSRCESAGGVR